MDFNRLQEFVMIANHGSFTKAAKELGISSATLGARFRTFEQSLGVALFEHRRSVSGQSASNISNNQNSGELSLTKAGALFYKDAVKIVREFQTLKEELAYANEKTFSSLRIAISGSGLPFFLGPFLDIINAKYPQSQLDLIDDTSYSITEGLLSGQVDFYFASVLNQFKPAGIARFLISHTQPHILLPSSHRLASNMAVSMKNLNNERFILYPEMKEHCIRDFQLANLQAAEIHYSLYEHNTSASFYELLVPIQKGIILSPTPFLNIPPNSVSVPVNDIKYEAPSSLFYNPNNAKPEIKLFISAFTNFIKEETRHEHTKAL